jgi:transcriptional pleiotropic regulator of transition state genes
MERKIDGIGRLLIPVELRRQLGIEPGDYVEVATENGRLVIKKHNEGKICKMCQAELKSIDEIKSGLCKACIEDVKERLELIG